MLFNNSSAPANNFIGGWQTNFILSLQTGQPFTVPCNISTAAFGCNALVNQGVSLYGSQHNVRPWMNPAAFRNPPVAAANGQSHYSGLGGAPTQLYGPGWKRFDFSLFKQSVITQERYFEFRSEFFNLPNHPNFGNPGFSAPGNCFSTGRDKLRVEQLWQDPEYTRWRFRST